MPRKVATEPAVAAPPQPDAADARAKAVNARNRIVFLSILLISAAAATMLYVQFDASAFTALLAGASALAFLLLMHEQSRKAAEIDRLKKELARTGAPSTTDEATAPDFTHAGAATKTAAPPKRVAGVSAPRRRISVLEPNTNANANADAREDAPAPQSDAPSDNPAEAPGPGAMAPSNVAGEPLRDQWAFRPREPVMAPAPGAATIETDLALVQRKIKALADEVNAAEAPRAAPQSSAFEYRPTSAEAALESSIDALKAAGGAMRDRRSPVENVLSASQSPFAGFSIPATAERIAVSKSTAETTVSAPPADALDAPKPIDAASYSLRLAAMSEAIARERIDVFLEPVIVLSTLDIAHYETRIRLQAPDGGYFDDACEDLARAGHEALTGFDAARLVRAATLARRLGERGKTGALLASVAGASLTSEIYLETLARIFEERNAISGQLALKMSQADVERFTDAEWQSLGDMNAFGFRFALDRVRHLDIDFDDLARRGFAHVKIDAGALLAGAPYRDRLADVAETQRRIAEAQMTLIASNIGDEGTRARLSDLGVALGQGEVFGAARRIAIEAPAGDRSAAA